MVRNRVPAQVIKAIVMGDFRIGISSRFDLTVGIGHVHLAQVLIRGWKEIIGGGTLRALHGNQISNNG